jgi:hypothetical protein
MRRWLLVLACSTAHADVGVDDGWRYTSRQVDIHPNMDRVRVPQAPPLATFTTPGTLYMLDVDGLQCHPWTVEPGDRGRGKLVGSVALDYESAGDRLKLCGVEWPDVAETSEGIAIYGAMWFRDAKQCAAARAKHRPIATDLTGCVATKQKPSRNTRARLERVLAGGGSLYTIVDNRCGEVTVAPDSRTHGEFRFALQSTDLRGRPIRGTTTWQYHFTPGADTIGVTDGSTAWSDGTGMGTLCAHDQPIALHGDSADIGGRYYFTRDGCRAGIAAARERASWLAHAPQPAPSEPDFGGC